MADNVISVEIDFDTSKAQKQIDAVNKKIAATGTAMATSSKQIESGVRSITSAFQKQATAINASAKSASALERDIRKLSTTSAKAATDFQTAGTNARAAARGFDAAANTIQRINFNLRSSAAASRQFAKDIQQTMRTLSVAANRATQALKQQNQQLVQNAQTAKQASRGGGGGGGVGTTLFTASALAAPAYAVKNMLETAAGVERLQRTLSALADSEQQATQWFTRLAEIAREPGIGLQEAISTFASLKAVISDDEFILDFTANLANLVALGGGGAEVFGLVSEQFAQMAASGKIVMQDLRPIITQLKNVRPLLQELYKTSDPEKLEKMGITGVKLISDLNVAMSKKPTVLPGIQDQLDNLADTIRINLLPVMKDISKELEGWIRVFGQFLNTLSTGWQALPAELRKLIIDASLAAAAFLALAAAWTAGALALGKMWTVLKDLGPLIITLISFISRGGAGAWGAVIGGLITLGILAYEWWSKANKEAEKTKNLRKGLELKDPPKQKSEQEIKRIATLIEQAQQLLEHARAEELKKEGDFLNETWQKYAEHFRKFKGVPKAMALAAKAFGIELSVAQGEAFKEHVAMMDKEREIAAAKYRERLEFQKSIFELEHETTRKVLEDEIELAQARADLRSTALEAIPAQTADQQIARQHQLAQIQIDAVNKVHDHRLDLYDDEYDKAIRDINSLKQRQIITEEEAYEAAVVAGGKYEQQRVRLANDADIEIQKLRLQAVQQTNQLILAEYQRIFDQFKSQAERIFDALLDRSTSLFQALGNSIKTIFLTAMKDIVTSRIAASFTQLLTGERVSLEPGMRSKTGFGRFLQSLGLGAQPVFGDRNARLNLTAANLQITAAQMQIQAAGQSVIGGGTVGKIVEAVTVGSGASGVSASRTAEVPMGLPGGMDLMSGVNSIAAPAMARSAGGGGGSGFFGGLLQNAMGSRSLFSGLKGRGVPVWGGSPYLPGTGILAPQSYKWQSGLSTWAATHPFFFNSGSIAMGSGTATTAAGIGGIGGGLAGFASSPAGGMAGGMALLAGAKMAPNHPVLGTALATGGGALAGFMLGAQIGAIGGPIGAAIGAAVGLGVGLVMALKKSAVDKVGEKIKQVYGITVSDRKLLASIAETAKTQYGGNIDVAVRSPAVMEIVRLYAMSTGMSANGLPRPMYGVTFQQSAAGLQQQPVYSGGSLVTSPYTGVTTAQWSQSATYIQLDPRAANNLLAGQVVEIIGSNPGAVAQANEAATRSGVNRNAQQGSLMEPLTVMNV